MPGPPRSTLLARVTVTTEPPRASLGERVRDLLASPRLIPLVALLAALLTAPTLLTGLHTEDHVQRQLVENEDYRIPWKMNLFGRHAPTSLEDTERTNYEYRIYGWFPWITDPRFAVSFWRPLSSLTHIIDYRYLRGHAGLMHAEGVAWYALLAVAVALLYRRLMEPLWVAGLAAVLYAVDDAHGHAVGWLANRNGIMAAVFGVLALWAHDRWRREGWTAGALVGPVLFGVGLLSAEFALCAGGYLIAYAIFVDEARWSRRLGAVLPWVAVAGAWAFAYRSLGHAARGSGLYIDPLSDPIPFAFEFFERGTVLLLGQFGTPPSNLWTWVDRARQGYVVFGGAVFLLFVAKMLWPILRRDRTARFWALGTLLSLPPACATFPEDRLLFFAGLGAMPLVAVFLVQCFDAATELWSWPRLAKALGVFFVAVHALAAPLFLPFRSLYMHRYDARIEAAGDKLFRHVREPSKDSLIVVNGEDFYFLGMLPLTRVARNERTVGRMLSLAGTLDDVEMRRLNDTTLEVRPRDGFLSRVFNRIYRGLSQPMRRGSQVNLLGVDITVTEVNQWSEPLAARFEFALPLEDKRFVWVAWKDDDFIPFRVPKVGETVVVRGR